MHSKSGRNNFDQYDTMYYDTNLCLFLQEENEKMLHRNLQVGLLLVVPISLKRYQLPFHFDGHPIQIANDQHHIAEEALNVLGKA